MKHTIILLFSVFCLIARADDNRQTLEDSAYQTKRKFDYFYLEALRLKENDKQNEAYAALQYALKIDSTSSAVLSMLADYYSYLQEDSLAIDALQQAVKYSPQNFDYKVSLADAYREIGKLAEATRLYEDLVAEQPAKPELNFYLSDLYLKQNQTDKAIQSLDALENTIGMNEALSMQKYQLYLTVQQPEKAVNELEKLAAKYPADAKYQTQIGDFYLDREDSEKALVYYEKAHKIDPQSPYYVTSMANYYEVKGDSDAAINEIELALKNPLIDIDTKTSILGKYIGTLMSNKRDMEIANSLFKTLMEDNSQDTDLNLMYAQFLLYQEKWEDAQSQLQVVTEADPENLLAWRLLRDISVKQEKWDRIVKICDSALAVFPDNPEFYFYKGLSYYQLKNYPDAMNTFQKGVLLIPKDDKMSLSEFYGQIGDLYHQMDNKEEAYKAYDKALGYNESNIGVLNNYAYFLSLDKVQLDKAERMSLKCIQMQPKNPTYIDTYAWVLFQRGNYSLAKFYIESALSYLEGDNPEILEHYGDILYKTGNKDKAVEQWEKALDIKKKAGEDATGDITLLEKKVGNKMYYETK